MKTKHSTTEGNCVEIGSHNYKVLSARFLLAVWRSEDFKEVLMKNQCMKFMIISVFMWFLDMFYVMLFGNNRFSGIGCFHSLVKAQGVTSAVLSSM